ncbi:MAG: O-antigen ligase family protein [Thermoleophilia bacterium]
MATEPTKASPIYTWLGTCGVLAVFAYLAARDGGYFSINFYPAAIASWTILGLVILAGWDDLWIPKVARPAVWSLAAVALWTGLSFIWSISPGLSLQEFTRVSIYLACFAAVIIGPASARSVRYSAVLFVCVTTALAAFAMLSRINPDISQDYVYSGGRLMGSIGYWNGLAALMVLGIIPCLWLVSSPQVTRFTRTAFSCALSLMGLTLFFTLSRGGIAICIASVVLYLALAPDRLASILSLFSSMLPAGLLAWYSATTLPSLRASGDGIPIDAAEGRTFAILLAVALLASAAIKFATLLLPSRVPETRGGLVFILAFWVIVVIGIAGVTMVQRDAISEKLAYWRSKSDVQVWQYDEVSVDARGVERLASTEDNRTEFWRIGLENFKQHPLAGTGGGTYRFVNMKMQSGEGLARDPHSMWVRFLTDQGIVGFVLLLALMASLVFAATSQLLARPWLRGNGLYISLLIAALAWVADTSFEWNWALPAVSVPFFVLCGLLFRLGAASEEDLETGSDFSSESNNLPALYLIPVWLRMMVIALAMALTVMFMAFLASRILSDRARNSLSSGNLESAETSARRAHKLNPYSVDPLLVLAHAAVGRGDYIEARRITQSAIDREPERSSLYEELAQLEFYDLHDVERAIIHIMDAIDRDPQNDSLHIQLHRMLSDAVTYQETGLMPEPPDIEEAH